MKRLLELYGDKVFGSIKGLDRVRFRGTLRWLANDRGLTTYMSTCGLLLKDFGRWAQGMTDDLRESCAEQAGALSVDTVYLRQSGVDKEQLARRIAVREGRQNGSICMFSAVEPCRAPEVRGNRQAKTLELHMAPRKCVHVYHYFDHAEVGFGHVRLQTWLPFTVQVCLNGRHWLEKQLQREGIGYVKDGNCFPFLEDVAAAQRLLDLQLQTAWVPLLDGLLAATCPALGQVLAPLEPAYYWSADETEYAADLMFRDSRELSRLYPHLIRHGIVVADTPSVLRFFGKRNLTASGQIAGRTPEEVHSDWRRRAEGLRLKHVVNRNSVKMYDKSGSILRVETTINDPREFKVYRHPDDDPNRPASWQRLRKGISDLHRRCQVSDQCNERYADMLASAQVTTTLREVAGESCNRRRKDGRSYRGLNPWRQDDFQVLRFLGNGEWALHGFRNRDLRRHLFPDASSSDPALTRRRSGHVTRLIKLLRVHGLVRKVPREKRYVLTAKGQTFTTSLLTASDADIQQLTKLAA